MLVKFKYHGDWYCQLAVAKHANMHYTSKVINHFRMHPQSHLAKTSSQAAKIEYFRILDLLNAMSFVKGKKELIDFFALEYLGFGLLKEGPGYGLSLYREYKKINNFLAKDVWRSILWQKLHRKKRKPLF
jgi:hypothetical protein